MVKYQTLNSKSDNLSFEVFFLFFANLSRLTAVDYKPTFKKSGRLGRGWARVQLWDRLGAHLRAKTFLLTQVKFQFNNEQKFN